MRHHLEHLRASHSDWAQAEILGWYNPEDSEVLIGLKAHHLRLHGMQIALNKRRRVRLRAGYTQPRGGKTVASRRRRTWHVELSEKVTLHALAFWIT